MAQWQQSWDLKVVITGEAKEKQSLPGCKHEDKELNVTRNGVKLWDHVPHYKDKMICQRVECRPQELRWLINALQVCEKVAPAGQGQPQQHTSENTLTSTTTTKPHTKTTVTFCLRWFVKLEPVEAGCEQHSISHQLLRWFGIHTSKKLLHIQQLPSIISFHFSQLSNHLMNVMPCCEKTELTLSLFSTGISAS